MLIDSHSLPFLFKFNSISLSVIKKKKKKKNNISFKNKILLITIF